MAALSTKYVIILHGGSVLVHGIEVVDGLNVTFKIFIIQLMETIKLPGYKGYDMHMEMYSSTHKADVILER